MIQYIFKKIYSQNGNTQMLVASSAIIATLLSYIFLGIFVTSNEFREKNTHYFNAYQIGKSVENKVKLRFQSTGDEEFSLLNNDGTYRYTEREFNIRSQLFDGQIYTLDQLVKEEFIIDSENPTSGDPSQLSEYDQINTTVKIMYEYVLESFVDGDARKKIKRIHYLVNLARPVIAESDTYTNTPYDANTPFYYLVSYADGTTDFLTDEHITFKFRSGNPIGSILLDERDLEHAVRAQEVVILPIPYRE